MIIVDLFHWILCAQDFSCYLFFVHCFSIDWNRKKRVISPSTHDSSDRLPFQVEYNFMGNHFFEHHNFYTFSSNGQFWVDFYVFCIRIICLIHSIRFCFYFVYRNEINFNWERKKMKKKIYSFTICIFEIIWILFQTISLLNSISN